MYKIFIIILVLYIILLNSKSYSECNFSIKTYNKAKEILFKNIYYDHSVTLYCGASFDKKGNVDLPRGFHSPEYKKRTHKIEIEHIVPAENFGRAFVEWRLGGPQCVADGKPYKGRRCAQTSPEFRRMEADMHNLAPAIGAVNAARRNARFGVLPDTPSSFGSCAMKIADNIVEPPDDVKGFVARTSLYMAQEYPRRYRLSRSQRQLFEAWDRMFPPDDWECERAQRIWKVQGNPNTITERRCVKYP